MQWKVKRKNGRLLRKKQHAEQDLPCEKTARSGPEKCNAAGISEQRMPKFPAASTSRLRRVKGAPCRSKSVLLRKNDTKRRAE